MGNKRGGRDNRTRCAILRAAAELFGKRSFEDVTMREIAKEAGFSHTTIYIHFEDKEELLNHLATGPLMAVKEQLRAILNDDAAPAEDKLLSISRKVVHFALENRTMYAIFFTAKPTRVDDKHPALQVQRLRNELFDLLGEALGQVLCIEQGDGLLAYTRSYFFLVHGMIASYVTSDEPVTELFERLGATFDLAFRSMLRGFMLEHGDGGLPSERGRAPDTPGTESPVPEAAK